MTPSIYTRNHPELTVSNLIEKIIGSRRVKAKKNHKNQRARKNEIIPLYLIYQDPYLYLYVDTQLSERGAEDILTFYLLVSTADNLCNQFRPRSGQTKLWF